MSQMKQLRIISGIVLLLAISLSITGCNPYKKEQKDLANELGVSINDYPYRSSFPSGYFYSVLEPGMTLDEVHSIIMGYKKVLNCDYRRREVYYYFSTEDTKALRFEIVYDDNLKYWKFRGEDDDSRTIWTKSCEPGLIENQD
jgi:hypothetical protein